VIAEAEVPAKYAYLDQIDLGVEEIKP